MFRLHSVCVPVPSPVEGVCAVSHPHAPPPPPADVPARGVYRHRARARFIKLLTFTPFSLVMDGPAGPACVVPRAHFPWWLVRRTVGVASAGVIVESDVDAFRLRGALQRLIDSVGTPADGIHDTAWVDCPDRPEEEGGVVFHIVPADRWNWETMHGCGMFILVGDRVWEAEECRWTQKIQEGMRVARVQLDCAQ